ncbi:MAG TPA: deaminase [Acidobacteriota bacterium]|nr:deaminase [Acidobacteriota bacterium]
MVTSFKEASAQGGKVLDDYVENIATHAEVLELRKLFQAPINNKRDSLTWDEAIIGMATILSGRSKDSSIQVGSVLLNDQMRVIGMGYNGFPKGCSDDVYPWSRPEKYPYIMHGEVNGLENSFGDAKGGTMYVTHHPCHQCAQEIAQRGIKRVVYRVPYVTSDEASIRASHEQLRAAGVQTTNPSLRSVAVSLDLTSGSITRLDKAPPKPTPDLTKKRQDVLGWDDAYMAVALYIAQRSKDPNLQSGAVLISGDENGLYGKNRIIGVGYNGLSRGMQDWKFDWFDTKLRGYYIIPAPRNCIVNAPHNVKGSILYTNEFPDNLTVHKLITRGVAKVVYRLDPPLDNNYKVAERLCKDTGIELMQYKPGRKSLILDHENQYLHLGNRI